MKHQFCGNSMILGRSIKPCVIERGFNLQFDKHVMQRFNTHDSKLCSTASTVSMGLEFRNFNGSPAASQAGKLMSNTLGDLGVGSLADRQDTSL